MAFIKICGIQSFAEVRDALDCGATALGFLLGLTHRAEDATDAATAADIIRRLPPRTETVVVTHWQDPMRVAGLADATGATTIQVHDHMAPAALHALRRLAPRVRLVKAVHVTDDTALQAAREHADCVDALLLDSRSADRLGGTGLTHDWTISRRIVEAVSPLPVYLAGGLRPGNVAAAVAAVRPAGVDVNSGVEDAGGGKDPAAMRAFVALATAALRRERRP